MINKFIATEDLRSVFSGRARLPTITLWNRLEGRPRQHDFDRALKAEIRDPLWMLTKQWQMGEFEGDDAGSPVFAKLHVETTRLTKYRPAGHRTEAFDNDIPLEAKVERKSIPFQVAGQKTGYDIRLALGRRWLKLISGIEPGLAAKFIAALPVPEPDAATAAAAQVAAHRESWQAIAAVAGRMMDGLALIDHLAAAAGNHAHDLVALADPASAGPLEAAEAEFFAWYQALFLQPEADSAWLPDRLEYAFETSAPKGATEKHLVADEYAQGHLDWYSLDYDSKQAGLGPADNAPLPADVEAAQTASFIPVPIRFDGMPNTRWWTFEEGRTNFGDIDPDTTEVNKLLLMEFGLIYANDWFLLPLTVPAGTIATIAGLTVTNVFGERTWVEAAGRGADDNWQRWAMYTLSTRGSDAIPADLSLLILPAVPKIQESEPVETVELIRDEMANMVWGIETRITLPHGRTKSGAVAARETLAYHRRLVEAAGPPTPAAALLENQAAIRYQVMTQMPEHWIPFVPVHVENDTREIQLRRAALHRIINGDPDLPVRIEPRTGLLRQGLDLPASQGYDLHEEEVPRSGVRVSHSFQRSRWYGGQTFVWYGARKQTGRGEGSSRLAFDQIPPKPAT